MIRAAERRLVQPSILAAGDPVVGDSHFKEVTHHVELVPGDVAEMWMAVDRVERMDIAVGQLGRQNDRDPLLDLGAESHLRFAQFGIAFGIDRQRQADGFDRVVHVGVAPRSAGVLPVRFTPDCLGGVDQVYQLLSGAAGFHLPDAVRQPFLGQPLDLLLPESADADLLEFYGLKDLPFCATGKCAEAEDQYGGWKSHTDRSHDDSSWLEGCLLI